jgi:tetratricopeptide (TPR) repeat protein
VLQRNPNSADIRERLAQAYYLKGLRDDAIQLYEELVYQHGYRQALLGLGEAKDDRGDSQSAVKAYDKFLATESEDRNKAIAHVKKGLALAHLGSHKDALGEYREALKYAPGDVLILVHEALERANADEIDYGIAELKTVVNENRNSESLPFARAQLGVLLEKKHDWQGAVEQYDLAAQEQPNYVEAHHKLAGALLHENQAIRALDEYRKAARLSPSDVERGNSDILAHQWLANGLRDQHNYPDAALAYRKAIQLKSDNSAAHCQLRLCAQITTHSLGELSQYNDAING